MKEGWENRKSRKRLQPAGGPALGLFIDAFFLRWVGDWGGGGGGVARTEGGSTVI